MSEFAHVENFPSINRGYNTVFKPGKLSVGLVVPLESYTRGPVPTMKRHLERAQLAEELGFSALWLRDVPFDVPSFGDAGQIYDPFVYLGFLAAKTERIALGMASVVLPLRHPAHVAKAAASADVLSGGRLLLGVASGDRPEEYPALNIPFEARGERFRESFSYIRGMNEEKPSFQNMHGSPGSGMNMLPKASGSRLPMLITGGSQQSPEWIAQNGDGWMIYPRHPALQARIVADWRARLAAQKRPSLPAMQPLYVDLTQNPDHEPEALHLGFRLGSNYLLEYLKKLEGAGINHVALNLRFNREPVETTLERISRDVLPSFAL